MTRKITLLAFIPALALGLSACGSSTTETGVSTSASSTSSVPMPSESSTTATTTPSESSTTATTTTPSESSSPAPADTAKAVLSISDFAFTVPASVAPGASITITNADSVMHTVTSEAGGFDVKVNPNGTATLTAPSKPGSYPFVCAIHASMTGTLVVK